jgi:hypothetical protein
MWLPRICIRTLALIRGFSIRPIPPVAAALALAGLLLPLPAEAAPPELRDAELVAAGSPVLQNAKGTVRLEDARLGRLGPLNFVPEPGAVWQLGSGLGLLALLARRRQHRRASDTGRRLTRRAAPATPRKGMP